MTDEGDRDSSDHRAHVITIVSCAVASPVCTISGRPSKETFVINRRSRRSVDKVWTQHGP